MLPRRLRTRSGVGTGGRRRQCQGNRRQARARGRDPLVHAVRESVIEIRLESRGARAHVPRPILQLRVQQVLNAPLVGRARKPAGRNSAAPSSPGPVVYAPLSIEGNVGPPAVGALHRQQVVPGLQDGVFALATPDQAL